MIQTITDVDSELTVDVLAAIRDEFESNQTHKKFDKRSFTAAWDELIRRGIGGIWTLNHGGMLIGATGAIASIEPIEGITVVAQCFLFLRKEHRSPSDALRLMNAIEMFATSKKASRIVTAVCYDTLDGKQAEFLIRHGYHEYEVRYYKNLSWEQKP